MRYLRRRNSSTGEISVSPSATKKQESASDLAKGATITALAPSELTPKAMDSIAEKLLTILEARDTDQRTHRRSFSKGLIWLIGLQFILISIVAIIVARQSKLDGTAFVAFVTAFFGQVVAIAVIVAKNLFPETNKDLAETLAAVLKK